MRLSILDNRPLLGPVFPKKREQRGAESQAVPNMISYGLMHYGGLVVLNVGNYGA